MKRQVGDSTWRFFISTLDVGTVHLAVSFPATGYVEPAGAVGAMLEEELVETAVLEDILGIELAGGLVGQADVGCLSGLVLGILDSSYQLVEPGTTIT